MWWVAVQVDHGDGSADHEGNVEGWEYVWKWGLAWSIARCASVGSFLLLNDELGWPGY